MSLPLPSLDQAYRQVQSCPEGLTSEEATARLGRQQNHRRRRTEGAARLLLNQFRSPLVLLLLSAMAISALLGDRMDVLIVLAVVLMSTLLGFWQEYRAANALAALLAVVRIQATVLRDGREEELPVEDIAPGDIVLLKAGDALPGDGLLIESKDLFVDESTLTGESFPAEKLAAAAHGASAPNTRANAVFEGTHVISGTARVLVLKTGADTEFGGMAESLRLRAPETDFERGLRRFGELLLRVTLVFVVLVFALNLIFDRPVLDAFTFALALAVGMTPELLPAIVSITLARGAKRLAEEHVIVRHLPAIENFGAMTVLCSDKTGTLTEGRVKVRGLLDAHGEPSAGVRLDAVLNATFESGFANPIDKALRAEQGIDLAGYTKRDEVPYDFIRKRLSIVVEKAGTGHRRMITKGAFSNVLAVCSRVATPAGSEPIPAWREVLQQRFAAYCGEGHRVLALASRDVSEDPIINQDDERDMNFEGFLLFEDPPKEGVAEAIAELERLGVDFKVITGDNRLAAQRLGRQMGLAEPSVLTGDALHAMSDAALVNRVGGIDLFAEIEPNQKERIILALRKAGHVVGYLGDGINDASALHAADVGISVDGAVDVAKEAADIVLLKHDLEVLARGVRGGRTTFDNTLKYVQITSSANFGNMCSMALASLALPFLPLLPKQILLNNFLSDLPALSIATDAVDEERIRRPRRWDTRSIRRFMITFGLVSSVFDGLTFAVLLLVLRASEAQFQTGWFIESLMTELFIVLVMRTHRPLFRSRPGRVLTLATLAVAASTVLLPYTSLGSLFGLVPLPWPFMAVLAGITLLYLGTSEILKRRLFAHLERQAGAAL